MSHSVYLPIPTPTPYNVVYVGGPPDDDEATDPGSPGDYTVHYTRLPPTSEATSVVGMDNSDPSNAVEDFSDVALPMDTTSVSMPPQQTPPQQQPDSWAVFAVPPSSPNPGADSNIDYDTFMPDPGYVNPNWHPTGTVEDQRVDAVAAVDVAVVSSSPLSDDTAQRASWLWKPAVVVETVDAAPAAISEEAGMGEYKGGSCRVRRRKWAKTV
ncbi:hypothetical protein BDW02DRAFT_594908 [Decorospora gaudefroyi]|uniref:Uncharacterized protein n=1 Tax=Decorospora gaudefroyi TaxID=184978 RepID=A0A6A5KIR4_9PLEO|nr:hypothetical protein BDW02DRAFT_594908 [Decorospora gaudefroyi]